MNRYVIARVRSSPRAPATPLAAEPAEIIEIAEVAEVAEVDRHAFFRICVRMARNVPRSSRRPRGDCAQPGAAP